jgi:hypothetical protein
LDVELSGGPADGPAFHDFHHLQIAWDDVWTASVDEQLAAKMAELFEQTVEIVDWGNIQPDLSEVSELEDFLDMLEEALKAGAGALGVDLDELASGAASPKASESFVDQVFGQLDEIKDLGNKLGDMGKGLMEKGINEGAEVAGYGGKIMNKVTEAEGVKEFFGL